MHRTDIGGTWQPRSDRWRCAADWIHATPDRVWQEFESLERMRRWFGTGHALVEFSPEVGAEVETDAGEHAGEALRFVGRVVVFDPPHELTFEQDWVGHGWAAPPASPSAYTTG